VIKPININIVYGQPRGNIPNISIELSVCCSQRCYLETEDTEDAATNPAKQTCRMSTRSSCMNAFPLIGDVVTPPLLCIIYSQHILAVLLSTSDDLQGTTRPRTLPAEFSSTPPHLGRMLTLTDVHIQKELTTIKYTRSSKAPQIYVWNSVLFRSSSRPRGSIWNEN
jgi:hypothetical protein